MEAPSLAEALSEDTHFRPTSTNPLTQGVRRFQDLDMRRAAAEAKKASAEQKRRDMAAASIVPIDEKANAWTQKELTDLAAKNLFEQTELARSGDIFGVKNKRQEYYNKAEPAINERDNVNQFLQHVKSGGYAPDELIKAVETGDKGSVDRFIKNNPHQTIVAKDPNTGRVQFSHFNGGSLSDSFKKLEEGDDFYTDVIPGTAKRDIGGSTITQKQQMSPKMQQEKLSSVMGNPSDVAKVLIDHGKEIDEKIEKAKPYNYESLSPEEKKDVYGQLKTNAVHDVIEGLAKPHFQKNITKQIYHAPQNGSQSIISSPSTGNDVKMMIDHPNKAGIERSYPATSKYNAQVEITNGEFPTSLVKEAKNGKSLKSKDPLTLLKSGTIQVYPMYKGLDKNNRLYGRIVNDENISKLDPSQYEYKPVLVGRTNDDDQVLVEFDSNNDVMNTLKRGSKDRQAQTNYDINKAYEIAQQENNKKTKHNSSKAVSAKKTNVSNIFTK